jgi:hypothetical protein
MSGDEDRVWNFPACSNCRFFRYGGEPDDDTDVGDCRRYAPRPSEGGGLRALWPEVHLHEWCGEWEGASRAETEGFRRIISA